MAYKMIFLCVKKKGHIPYCGWDCSLREDTRRKDNKYQAVGTDIRRPVFFLKRDQLEKAKDDAEQSAPEHPDHLIVSEPMGPHE